MAKVKSLVKRNPESAIQDEVWDFLNALDAFPIRNENQGQADFKQKTFRAFNSRYKRRGVSDLMFFFAGETYFNELKSVSALLYINTHIEKIKWFDSEDQPKHQKARYKFQYEFLCSVAERGCKAFFADSVQGIAYNILHLHKKKPSLYMTCEQLQILKKYATKEIDTTVTDMINQGFPNV